MVTDRSSRAFAFAPGHVTGLFVADLSARDPRGRGSRGAGLVLELGATAEATRDPSGPDRLRVTTPTHLDLPITVEAVRHLLPSHSGSVRVRVCHGLPVGQGFGMSAAGTLAATLAVAHLVEASPRRAHEAAHLAELFGGGGLGGVAAILGGGLEVRLRAGLPPRGRVFHRPFAPRVLVGVVGGPIPSPRALSDPRLLARIRSLGEALLGELGNAPAPESVWAASEQFTEGLDRAPARLRTVLGGLRRRRCWSAQAMFGRSFFAIPQDDRARASALKYLLGGGVATRELRAAPHGARLLRSAPGADASILTGRPSRRRR